MNDSKNPGSSIWALCERIAHWLLSILFKLIKKDLTDEVFQGIMQFVKFGLVGVTNTVLNYAIYVGVLIGLRKIGILPGIDYLVAQAVAFVLSVLWSFWLNSMFVFTLKEGEERHVGKALVKTFISYSFTGLFLNSVLLIFWVRLLHMSEFIAPIINLLISVPINFIINKFWAFRHKSNTTDTIN